MPRYRLQSSHLNTFRIKLAVSCICDANPCPGDNETGRQHVPGSRKIGGGVAGGVDGLDGLTTNYKAENEALRGSMWSRNVLDCGTSCLADFYHPPLAYNNCWM